MELLAPAGNLETATAALEYGADAVYAGLKSFSARADADNFSMEELATLLGYAHSLPRPRRVYIALNTLLREDELPQVEAMLTQLATLPIDGLIVQDPALLGYVRRWFPSLPIHASTQMAVHNAAGMRFCRQQGYTRVIAARELTLNELGEMAREPGIELEVFVHGALCCHYSGLCLLSSVLDHGRSGNRGECSYVCRNSWRINDANGKVLSPASNVMSMKDLSLADQIGAFKKLGVASLKIEGRKKSPLYVAAVTNLYRHLIDGDFKEGEREQAEQDVRTIFSRPWTTFFLRGERTPQVTDTATTGPRGTAAGVVGAVIAGQDGKPDRLRFKLQNLILEKHDGLQVELDGRERPYGFAVEEIYAFSQGNQESGERVFTAPPTTTIEVPLPPGHPVIQVGQPIFCTSSQQVRQRYHWPSLRPALVRHRLEAAFDLAITKERATVKARHCSLPASLTPQEVTLAITPDGADSFQTARDAAPEKLLAGARRAFEKLGDTPYTLKEFSYSNPGGFFLPASQLNDLRRQATAALEQSLAQSQAHCQEQLRQYNQAIPFPAQDSNNPAPQWVVKIDQPYLLNLFEEKDFKRLVEVVVDIGRMNLAQEMEALELLQERCQAHGTPMRLALPAIMRRSNWEKTLRTLADAGWKKWQVANPGAIQLLRELIPDAHITADWPLYTCNTMAAHTILSELQLQRLTLAPDDPTANTATLLQRLGAAAEVIVFQDTPLAISAVCANASLKGGCPGKNECTYREFTLTSRNGTQLLAVNDSCQTIYLNQHPLDRSREIPWLLRNGAKILRADFIWRNWTPAAVKRQWETLVQ